MNNQSKLLALATVGAAFAAAGAAPATAQIVNPIQAHIAHSFVVGNTTLPPGQYTFSMMHNSDLQVMTVTSPNEKTSVEFIVRPVIDDHNPRHTELIFRKSGDTEFLTRIFESGSRTGVAVAETSLEETRLSKQGQSGAEHMETAN